MNGRREKVHKVICIWRLWDTLWSLFLYLWCPQINSISCNTPRSSETYFTWIFCCWEFFCIIVYMCLSVWLLKCIVLILQTPSIMSFCCLVRWWQIVLVSELYICEEHISWLKSYMYCIVKSFFSFGTWEHPLQIREREKEREES